MEVNCSVVWVFSCERRLILATAVGVIISTVNVIAEIPSAYFVRGISCAGFKVHPMRLGVRYDLLGRRTLGP